jgi:DNA processing protein
MTPPIRVLQRGEAGYPERLEAMAGPPARVWVRGEWPLPQRPVVALVGARAASGAAMARTADLSADLSRRGALVISGGAIGIDSAAHLGALRAGLPTLAVVAPGLDDPYPARNARMFEDIVSVGGALLSSIPPGTPVQKWHFPARNHVIAALADAVVVTECGALSGSTITARAARALGRAVGASPGSTGTDALVAAGAALVEHADDVFAALAGRPRQPQVAAPDPGSSAALVLEALDLLEPRGLEAVAARTGLPVRRCASALSELELSGLTVAVPGGRFLKSAGVALAAAPASPVLAERN